MTSPTYLPAFSQSTRLVGFVPAVINWMESNNNATELDWRDTLAQWKGDGVDPVSDEYFFMRALKKSRDTTAFAKEVHLIIQRRKDADKKRGGKAGPANRFKDRLAEDWILAALWCRTPSGVLSFIDPTGKHDAKAIKFVMDDFSRLKLTPSRHPEHEKVIDEAEARFKQRIDY